MDYITLKEASEKNSSLDRYLTFGFYTHIDWRDYDGI